MRPRPQEPAQHRDPDPGDWSDDDLGRVPNDCYPNMAFDDGSWSQFLGSMMPKSDRALSWPERFRYSLIILCLGFVLMVLVVFVMLPVIAAHFYAEYSANSGQDSFFWD